MNTWILIIGIAVFIFGLFLAIVGGVERFHLYRENELWLAAFVIGIIMIVFGIGFMVFAFFFDRKRLVTSKSLKADNFWTVNIQWPFGMLNMMRPQETKVVIKEKQTLGRMIDTVPVVISAPLKRS